MSAPDLVIGGGLAGAAVAIRLAEAGREVVVLEKESGAHDKVCGEFLSYEAVRLLRRLGVDPVALGGVALDRVAVCVGRSRADAPLPFQAVSLSRRVLDAALLDRAATAGAEVRRGVRVIEANRAGQGWLLRTSAGDLAGAQVFLATGKHDLRGWKRPVGSHAGLIGFKVHLKAPPQGTVELHLFPGGYIGWEPVEAGRASLCLVVRKVVHGRAGGGWGGLIDHLQRACPQLAGPLERAREIRPGAIAAIPYGHVAWRADGLWRLGDQAAVIPSFAGEGMSIALYSAEKAARFVLAGRSPQAFQAELAGRLTAQVGAATLLSRAMVQGWAQPGVAAALALAPGLAGLVARGTRLSARAQGDIGRALAGPA